MRLSWKHLLLAATLLLALFLALVYWQAMVIRKESEYHEYHYHVSIQSPSAIGNCTLLLPVPSVQNRSPAGDALVRGEGYSVPGGWRLSLEPVNGTPMLRISAPSIVPEYHGYPVPIEPGSTPSVTPVPATAAWSEETPVLIPLEFGVSLRGRDTIDTRTPPGREPLLGNPLSLSPVPCRGPSGSGHCYQYRAPLYVKCLSGDAGNLTLSISAGGTNQWWMGGWSGNSYQEDIVVTPGDSRSGWTEGEGFLSTGLGRY
jgi:hypothetical protein